MATKQEKAVQRAVTREKKKGKVREEKHVLWLLLAIILLLLYLLFAQHNGWWPYSRPKLGSAFYTNVSASTTEPSSSSSKSGTGGANGGGTGSSSGSGSTGSGSSGSNTGGGSPNGGSGSTTTPPSGSSPIADFAATVNVGDTKTQVESQANGLSEKCAVVVTALAQTVGKQEVCTYTQGDKIITVTYLNDRVISASKSGF